MCSSRTALPPIVLARPRGVADVGLAPPCRPGCGACCIAPSISSPMPGAPLGKPAGVPCVNLDEDRRCRIFGDPRRPAVCASLQPSRGMCGDSAEEALAGLTLLELETAPGAGPVAG